MDSPDLCACHGYRNGSIVVDFEAIYAAGSVTTADDAENLLAQAVTDNSGKLPGVELSVAKVNGTNREYH